jgi:hypothetical protein
MLLRLTEDGFVYCADPAQELRALQGIIEDCIEGAVAKQDLGRRRVLEDKGRALVVGDEVDKDVELSG